VNVELGPEEEEHLVPHGALLKGKFIHKRTATLRKKQDRLTYRYKKRPYVHQVKALKKLIANGYGGALLMQARTGKTKVAVDYSGVLHTAGRVNRVLVVCPKNVMDVWLEQIEDNIPDDITWRVTIWDKKGRKREQLPRVGQDVLDFVIVNYDAFSTPGRARKVKTESGEMVTKRSKSRGGKYDIRNALKAWQPQLLVLDESHRVKSPSAAKTRSLFILAWNHRHMVPVDPRIPYRVIMSGTPRTKKKRPHDLYSQWRILNPDRFRGMTLEDFKYEFGRWLQKDGYEQFIRARNEERLLRLIHKDSFFITREECYDLPKRLPDQLIHVPLSTSSGRVYDDMAEEMIAQIHTGEITEASIALVKTLRLSQITSGIVRTTNADGTKGRLVRIGREKLEMLEDLLEDLLDDDEKVIIGARYTADIQAIVKLGTKLKVPVFQVHGQVKDRDRWGQIQGFKKAKSSALYVAQPAASSEGIDLREAAVTIWYSLTSSWVHWDQFNDRSALNEKGQQMMYLIAGPVDQLLYDTLQEDDDVGKAVLKDPDLLRRSRD
jgi:SNF2 family DNA or RNA helicase